MAYSKNLLPTSAAYYNTYNASFVGTQLNLDAGGYAEIQLSSQLIASLVTDMLVVVHPSVFSNGYTNSAVQVTISLVDKEGVSTEFLIPVQYSDSGVFNTAITLPDSEFVYAVYRISSKVQASVYNWELCAAENVDIEPIIGGVKQALPRLLYDYNTYAYAVGQRETTVGLITCYLTQDTDLQGHFTLSFFATERCNVHVRIKDNGITELYTPQVYTVEKGYASVSIPHAYLKKLATNHNFSVTIQCTNGLLSIPVRGLLYTIDGGYLATRLLDAGIDIVDISIRQLSTETAPSEIWAIGFESQRLMLKKSAYDVNGEWSAVKDFGEMLAGAVEFAGVWGAVENSAKYTMYTNAIPFVAIVDTSNNLAIRYGDTFDDSYLVDTDVSEVAMCQGFSSMYYPEQDQGLVLVYIKNGNVHYAQYLHETQQWETKDLLYDGADAVHVSVHRLPDYRVGICVERPSGTKWYISTRTYVGQSVKTELIKSANERSIAACTILDVDHSELPSMKPTISTLTPDSRWHKQITVEFELPIKYMYKTSRKQLIDSISIKRADVEVPIESVVATSDSAFLITFEEEQYGNATITVDADCPGTMLEFYNGTVSFIDFHNEYLLPLPITTTEIDVTESKEVSVTSASLGILNRSIETINRSIATEVTSASASASVICLVNEIITSEESVVDSYSCNATATMTAEVQQTGTSPV